MTKRRKAREYALQFLYGIDLVALEPGEQKNYDLRRGLEEFWKGTGEEDPDVRSFAEALAKGTIEHLSEIDPLIQNAVEKWKLLRMAAIDRNIIRVAAYEILFRADIPDAVSINEALEIAKRFSTAESAAFINGILDRISKDFKKL
ncbi:MAG TPA: transcription antitermination factor NusB [Dissulfurispiraceae bacterium]|nr:transcription antitermination factor NusB [Dissulfurispiraceae bacterium]